MQIGCLACLPIVVVAACFHPIYDRPTCGPSGECPAGLSCSVDQICERSADSDGGLAGADAVPDGVSPPIDGQMCFGPFLNVCLSVQPTTPIVVSADLDINTDSGAMESPLCDRGIASYCVVAGTAITVAAGKKIRAHGSRPIVFVALGAFELFGEIDVTSNPNGIVRGAGASPAACAGAGSMAATGNSGGFGGSFNGRGGDGEEVEGTRGRAAPSIGFPFTLRGGCPGGTGGGFTSVGGAGGQGGGAVGIVAAMVRIDGRINASGAGGRGGPETELGAGGGGSGGMIVLDVPQSAITLGAAGRLFANGGGGGEGGGLAGAGQDGGASTGPNVAGAAGDSGGTGGAGGIGSAGSIVFGGGAMGNSQAQGGGGGGGGGAGYIHAPGIVADNIIAPPSVALPAD